jgi:uncharacterized protein YidB (DUF937 family)
MGLLDQVLGGLLGGGGSSPIQSVLADLGGGNAQPRPAQEGGNPQAGSGQAGGLSGLIASFEQAGLGHIAQSWIGNGPNQPVSPQQLHSVLGDDRVQDMAGRSGMEPHDFLAQLSQHLPGAVDRMTPNGQLPDDGTVTV